MKKYVKKIILGLIVYFIGGFIILPIAFDLILIPFRMEENIAILVANLLAHLVSIIGVLGVFWQDISKIFKRPENVTDNPIETLALLKKKQFKQKGTLFLIFGISISWTFIPELVKLVLLIADVEQERIMAYTNFIFFGVLTVGAAGFFWENILNDFKKLPPIKNFIGGVLKWWGLLYLINIVIAISTYLLSGAYDPANQQFLAEQTLIAPGLTFISIILFAPIWEEIIFRMILMDKFSRWPRLSIVFSSLIFGLLHIHSVSDLIFLPIYASMGLVMGYSYYKTKNIAYPIAIHFLQNLFASLVMLGWVL